MQVLATKCQREADSTIAHLDRPVVCRARPFSSLLLACVGLIAIAAMVMSNAGMTVAGVALGETMIAIVFSW